MRNRDFNQSPNGRSRFTETGREISLKAARAAEVDAVADTVSDTATDMNTETARPL